MAKVLGMDVAKTLDEGLAHHRAGRLGDAGRCYRAVLAAEPDNPDALNLMSVLAQAAGENELAANLALRATQVQPDWFLPYISLGNACQAAGRADLAVDSFQKAVTLNGRSAEGFSNLASALNDLGRHQEAAKMAVDAIMLDPTLADAHTNFGNALLALDSPGEAIEAYQKAVALRPDWDRPWYNVGVAFAEMGEHAEAVGAYARAVALADAPETRFNLGNSLAVLGRGSEAVEHYRAALALRPGYVDALNNLASVLKDLDRLEEAEEALRAALADRPDEAGLHWNLALVLLARGEWTEGWREYEWRWRMPTFAPFVRDFGKPGWAGEDLDGRTLLITAEQGFGDAIEFSRFVPLVAARGGRVVLECRKGLKRLFATLDGGAQVIGLGEEPPVFDLTAPLMSLPHLLGLGLGDLPGRMPYLAVPAGTADFSDVARGAGLKVGIVWAGGDSRRDNAQRSCTAADFRPLLDLPGCSFYALQVGPHAGQAASLPGIVDLAPRLGDFADTAAAIAALDLVISVDTGVVHCAGALGKPVWVLLSRPSNGFLWMRDRRDSPWYPGARLYRQPVPGDWVALMAEVRADLSALAGRGLSAG